MSIRKRRSREPLQANGHLLLVISATVVFAVSVSFPASYAQESDPLEVVLDQVGMTPADLTFDYDDMSNFGGDEFVLPLFQTYHRNPLRIPYYVDFHAAWLLEHRSDLSGTIGFCSQRIAEGSRRGLIGDPAEGFLNAADSLEIDEVLDSLGQIAKWRSLAHLTESDARTWTELPPLVRKAVKAILLASGAAYEWRERAFQQTAEQFDMSEYFTKSLSAFGWDDATYDEEYYEFIHTPRWKYLYVGAQDLGRVVRWAADTLGSIDVKLSRSVEIATPWGAIILRGRENDHYDADRYFLIIDIGGDDTYEAGAANLSYDQPVAILIDLHGNDRYTATTDSLLPSFGGGVFGYAYLIDRTGDDVYHGAALSQGAGLFGMGCLIDEAGNDTYSAHTQSQGSGAFGIGILSDASGADRYTSYLMSQGFGYTKGMGLLLDVEGRDTYVSNNTDIRYPSSQSPEHNDALSQGCGFGLRHDYVDGYSLAGGIGYLIDGGGNDTYSAGLFAQGCAYWYAIGVLWDRSGDDIYDGIWYVQGSGAHFGAGYLNDKSGNDHYTAMKNMAQGAGHDFTIGYLREESGNDQYDAPNLSLGGGNANGIGLFWDMHGDDRYRVTAGTTLGRANVAGSAGSLRDSIPTVGIFLDTGGGHDSYPPEKGFAGNGMTWTQPGLDTTKSLNTERGAGGDF